MITGRQVCAARAFLGWDADSLAEKAKVSRDTIFNIENGATQARRSSLEQLTQAFEDNGVEFTPDEGVRLRRDDVVKYSGIEGFKSFLDDVYAEAQKPYSIVGGGKPICVAGLSDKNFDSYLGDFLYMHIKRMNMLSGIKMYLLLRDRPETTTQQERQLGSYREYRFRSGSDSVDVPFYVYGDKFAVLLFDVDDPPQITVIRSSAVARAYREQFQAIWRIAEPLSSTFGKLA